MTTTQTVYVVMELNDNYEDRDAQNFALCVFRDPYDAVKEIISHVTHSVKRGYLQLDPQDLEYTDDEIAKELITKHGEYPFHTQCGTYYRIDEFTLQ